MASPRWSELAEELGIDWPRSDTSRPLPPLRTRAEPAARPEEARAPFDDASGSEGDGDGDGDGDGVDDARVDIPSLEDGADDALDDLRLPPGDGPPVDEAEAPGTDGDGAAAPSSAIELSDDPLADPDLTDLAWSPPAASSAPQSRSDDRFGDLGMQLANVLRAAHEAMGDLRRLEHRLAELRAVHASIGRALADASEQLQDSLDRLEPGERGR